jgi:magnesium transporter
MSKHHPLAHVSGLKEEKVILELIVYNREYYNRHVDLGVNELIREVKADHVNWINVDGLQQQPIIEKLQSHFCLHSLLVDDVVNDQRPKAEEYEDHLFVSLKMLYKINGPEIDYEQISFVLGSDFLLSFQEKEGDLFDAFRERIRLDQGRVRKKQADYLLYRLIDIIVDSYYNVLDSIGEQIETMEDEIRENASAESFKKIQMLKKELVYLHKALYPLREAISKLAKDESSFIREENIRYFSDVNDHVIHLIDLLDTYRDLTGGLTDYYINIQNTRLNEVIRMLTIISTIFIPLTFIVGVYGMNFEYFPELKWKYGYVGIWGLMILVAGTMVGYFRHKKWI